MPAEADRCVPFRAQRPTRVVARWLAGREGAADVAALRRKLANASPKVLMATRTRALAAGRPTAALIAQLVLVQRRPRDAGALLDTASLLVTVRLPAAAHPFVVAAQSTGRQRPTVAGVPSRAVALTVRGWVLHGLGRDKQAVSAFAASWRLSNALTETATGGALSATCLRKTTVAATWLSRRYSRGEPVSVLRPAYKSERPVLLPEVVQRIPASPERLGTWSLPLPNRIGDAWVYSARLQQLADEAFVRRTRLGEEAGAAAQRARLAEKGWSALKEPWHMAMYDMSHNAARLPAVRPFATAAKATSARYWDLMGSDSFWLGGLESRPKSWECSDALPEFERLLQALTDVSRTRRALDQAEYTQRLAIARLSASPHRRQEFRIWALRSAQNSRWLELGLAAQAMHIAGSFRHCGAEGGGDRQAELVAPFMPAPDAPCPCFAQANIDVAEVLEVTPDCEKFSITVPSPGAFGGFLSGEQAWRGGNVTFFAGVQGKIGYSVLRAEAKAGAYVVAGANGIVDAGTRIQVDGKLAHGVLQLSGGSNLENSFLLPAGPQLPYFP